MLSLGGRNGIFMIAAEKTKNATKNKKLSFASKNINFAQFFP
jgi:hypothetical protein